MLTRALILALACSSALAQLTVGGDDSDCALYLTGPGRSSAYDYSINLLKGNFGYEGQSTCITYEAVNQAYLEARQRILVSQPKGDWKPEDYASVGELVLDVSISLAKRYGLTYEEIEKGLPLIDTSRTLIREVCPPVFSHVECRAGKYRRLDGLCNNLKHPTWGSTNAPFQRLLSPLFSDGINSPRIAHSGHDLPLSRVVSRTMHPDDGFHDHAGTVMVIAWGQFMDHDYTLTGTPLDPVNRNDPEECCKRPLHLKHPYCNEIRIPDDDYFYRLFGVTCIDFVRGFPSPRPGCRLGSRVPFNTLTGSIDGNTVYGVTDKFARKLRTGFGGLLRMNPVFKEYGLHDLLPLKLDIPDEGCTRPNKNMYCFEAGEIRVNEQLVLTVMHTLMAREHNRVARGLAEVNPHWDDETLYQEARRINIAEIQHITYNEFLPILLGKDVMEKFGLVLEKEGYWEGYDEEVNPDVLASFAAAAYRFGHSLLPTAVERWSKAHKFIASKRLSDLIRRPYDLYRAGVLDEYVMGLMNQVAQAMDDSITQEVTNHLFKKVGARFGMDLVSFNMQRGREFGLPGYMEFRKFCGLPGAETFQDLFGSMSNHTVRKYETIFEHPVDVDLWSGGVSERPLPGSMLGPTFACIIATQFSYSRRGDRFWFELPNQPSSFTPDQLAEIRKSRLARVICDNTDIIDTVQLYPMVLPDHELNPRVPCRSGILPSMDFSKWADPVPFHGSAKEFITHASASRNITKSASNINETIEGANKKEDGNSKNDLNKTDSNTDIMKSSNDSKDNNGTVTIAHTNLTENQNDKVTLNKVETPNLLKYVTKKNEKSITPDKSTGSSINKLKRKRRAINLYTLDDIIKPPAIINFETPHPPLGNLQRDGEVWLRGTANVIKNADLADFNIETLHDNNNNEQSNKNINEPSNNIETNNEKSENSNESTDRENDDNSKERYNKESVESNERENESSENDKYSQKSTENYSNSDRARNYEDKNASNDKSNKSFEGDSSENNDSTEYNKSKYSKSPNVDESVENYSDDSKKKYSRDGTESKEESSEDTNYRPSEKSPYKATYESNPGPLDKIVDVDLGDYEKIVVNKNGDVEPARDSFQIRESDTSAEVNVTDKPYYGSKKNDKISLSLRDGSSSLESVEHNEPTHINDGEVKPVVEINAEANSGETSDESSDELNSKLENESLETLTGVNEPDSSEKSDKLQNGPQNQDVKQEFERIPLNYNHGANKENKDTKDTKATEDNASPKSENNDEGTIDNVKPRYDEHLNIKFDDVHIKLPDIKLPDDILSYAHEDPPVYNRDDKEEQVEKPYYYQPPAQVKTPSYYQHPAFYQQDKKENSPRFYHYSDEVQEEDVEENDKDNNRGYDDRNHYGYYGSDKKSGAYKQKDRRKEDEDEPENDDLYEKFVREKFGKRGSFKNRLEKLTDARNYNPILKEKVQNILKKTEDVQKQAVKSGDPNAGYMWTLEYGEQL